MKKRDFETYQKRFRDFEILPKFSETHVFRGTMRHPLKTIKESFRMKKCISFRAAAVLRRMLLRGSAFSRRVLRLNRVNREF